MADAMIRSGQVKTCLVVAAEVKSRSLDPADSDTVLLFGDGAGAVVLLGEQETGQPIRGLLGLRLHADGAHHGLITIPAGGSRRPTTAGDGRGEEPYVADAGGIALSSGRQTIGPGHP